MDYDADQRRGYSFRRGGVSPLRWGREERVEAEVGEPIIDLHDLGPSHPRAGYAARQRGARLPLGCAARRRRCVLHGGPHGILHLQRSAGERMDCGRSSERAGVGERGGEDG
uniref:Uncharacterized protein n=1 Tax=Arundo donax TaxID=35708 RepID=A0A0A9DXN0_ARUDO